MSSKILPKLKVKIHNDFQHSDKVFKPDNIIIY